MKFDFADGCVGFKVWEHVPQKDSGHGCNPLSAIHQSKGESTERTPNFGGLVNGRARGRSCYVINQGVLYIHTLYIKYS